MQFVHNHTVQHDRTAFEDRPEPARKRHLLRLWLAAPGARPLPEAYAERYGSVKVGNRGSIICTGTRRHAPLEAVSPVASLQPSSASAASAARSGVITRFRFFIVVVMVVTLRIGGLIGGGALRYRH